MNKTQIKVLVTDDSFFFREMIAKGLESCPDIKVVAKATDPFDARDKILQYRPDVMTCDVQMPKMDGVEFIRRLIPQYPIPVVVVSALSNTVFDALNAGAVDFVQKPELSQGGNIDSFINEIISKVIIAAKATVRNHKVGRTKAVSSEGKFKYNIIAIGASTGGTEAIYNILKELPPDMPGIVIVQHIPPVFSAMFSDRLNNCTKFKVSEAKTDDPVEPGTALVAPGDKHMIVKKKGDQYKVICYEGEKKNGHCPSVDVLFSSVADEAKSEAIGVILTGMGNDGAKGMVKMRAKGAKTIGQDESTSVVYGMPKTAYDLGGVEIQAHLDRIPDLLVSLVR